MNGFSWIKSLKINNSIFHLLILSISIYIKSRSTCQEVAPTPPPPPPACIYICPEGHSSMKEDETSTKQTNKRDQHQHHTLQYVFLPVVSILHTGPSSVSLYFRRTLVLENTSRGNSNSSWWTFIWFGMPFFNPRRHPLQFQVKINKTTTQC